jgi:hypothetical protein
MLGFLMTGARRKFLFLLPATLLCLMAANPAQAQRKAARKRPVKQAQPVPAAQPTPPPAPPTLEQMPAATPQVTFDNGRLTVVAHNSTLGDILRAVRGQTGAVVEIPANATERVVGNFGPGAARDVLAALLNGTHFDYVMLGSATNSSALERVILIPKSGAAQDAAPQTSAQQEVHPPVPNAQESDEETSNEDSSEDAGGEPEVNQPEDQQPQPGGGQQTIKTPEQLLQELRRQQQQQQPATPQGFPTPPEQTPQPPQ